MSPSAEAPREFDVVIIGAGFSGLHSLYRMRELGLRAVVLEMASGVGGTWFWNRYPGARCDIESVEYSYSFSPVIEQEWTWTEVLPGQAEIERYLNFVADRLDLRSDIEFGTRVEAMTYDEGRRSWTVATDRGPTYVAPFVIAASGILSAPLDPQIPGMDDFEGTSLHASRYPHEGFDFSGQRVALIGTGSTGVQAAPIVAAAAEHLYVVQRSAAYSLPSNGRPYEPGEFEALRARYAEIRAAQRAAFVGAARLTAFSVLTAVADKPPLLTATEAEREAAIDERGVAGALLWSDVLFDMEANRQATELYGRAIARTVDDPETAAALVPDYPFGCKRPIIDQGYYETFNRSNVTLVDLRKGAIERIGANGLVTGQGTFEVDVILYATGFDAMTGALTRIDIRGRDGVSLREVWAEGGPASLLGLMVAGFPNLFTIQGPGSPATTTNFATALEQHVDWIADCIAHLRERGIASIEATAAAQDAWVELTAALVAGSVVVDPTCNSWWNGSNVPGKRRVFLSYAAGIPEYRKHCDAIAAAGYDGFELER